MSNLHLCDLETGTSGEHHQEIRYYEEVKLFTVMELVYDHIEDIGIGGTIIKEKTYQAKINTILKHYNGGY